MTHIDAPSLSAAQANIANAGAQLHVAAHAGAEQQALIWDIFFKARGRGVSLNLHAPWLCDGSKIECISILADNYVVGCVVLRPYPVSAETTVGMIGFVCVRDDWRGRGLAKAMMTAAEVIARKAGLQALVLWTQTPAVYTSLGFQEDVAELLMQFEARDAASHEATRTSLSCLPTGRAGTRGLPAFANDAFVFSNPRASAIMLTTSAGPTLAEWHGDDADVAALVLSGLAQSGLTEVFWVNALYDDRLVAALQAICGAPLRKQPSTRLVKNLSESPKMHIPGIRILDRI